MRNGRFLVTPLVIVLAFASLATAASAAEYFVNGKSLKTKPAEGGFAAETEGIAENVPITSGVLEVPHKTEVRCAKLKIVKGLIKAPSSASASGAVFSGCADFEGGGGVCTVSSTIKMLALKGTPSTSTSPKAQLLVEPEKGTLLAEISYLATNPAPCYKSTELLTGRFTLVFEKGQTELAPQLGTINSAAGELSLNGESAFERVGGGEVSVESGHTSSFH